MFLCEIDCDYNGYDSNIKKSKCECEIKLRFPLISEITINKDKLLNNFKNITSIINLKIMKCYKELFTKEGFKNNIGSHIILFIIFCNILSFIFFAIKDFKNLYIIIDELYLETKNNNKTPNTTIHDKRMQNIQKEEDKIIKNEVKNARICNNNKNNHINSFKGTNESNIKILKTNRDNINEQSSSKEKIMNNKNIQFKNNIIKYNDNEMNSLLYKKTIQIDKRSYVEYYLSLLKRKQVLIFTFFINNDYNSKCVKICLFLFSFALYFAVNTLFFDGETMHKIYKDKGKYSFIYQIPIILYSALISGIINTIIKYLSLSENNIIEIKKIKT